MEKEIIKELMEGKKWYQKIVIRMFEKLFIETYHIARNKTINILLKK